MPSRLTMTYRKGVKPRRIGPMLILAASMLLLPIAPRAEAAGMCTVTHTPLNFGSYDVFSAADTVTTGTITYNCPPHSGPIKIIIDRGNRSRSFSSRTMRGGVLGGNHTLRYNLYLDAACTQIWGDGSEGTSVYMDPNPPPSTNVTINYYMRIPARQLDVPVGNYNDYVNIQAAP